MISVTQSALSTDYLQVQIIVKSPAGYDPTSDQVQFAFTTAALPNVEPAAWTTGSWATFPGPAYWAQCLVGPANGGVILAQGTWLVWVKITDSPTVPVLQDVALTINP